MCREFTFHLDGFACFFCTCVGVRNLLIALITEPLVVRLRLEDKMGRTRFGQNAPFTVSNSRASCFAMVEKLVEFLLNFSPLSSHAATISFSSVILAWLRGNLKRWGKGGGGSGRGEAAKAVGLGPQILVSNPPTIARGRIS